MLVAAIDPGAEAKLDGLNKALVSGDYLKENEGDNGPDVPVLASADSGMDEYAQTTLQQLTAPSVMPDMNAAWASAQASAPGRTVATERSTAQQAYNTVLKGLGPTITVTNRQGTFTGISFNGYWSVGPVDYQRTKAGALVPRQVANPPSVWYIGTVASVAMDDEDSQYRTVTSHANVTAQNSSAGPRSSPHSRSLASLIRPGSGCLIRCRRCRSAITNRWSRRRRPRPAAGRCTAAIFCPARTWVAWSASR